MPLYVIERRFAEKVVVTDELVRFIEEINVEEGMHLGELVPHGRPPKHVLPLRGALAGRARGRRLWAGLPAGDVVVESDRIYG